MWKIASTEQFNRIVDMCRELNREDPCPFPVPDEHMKMTLQILYNEPIRGKAVVLEVEGTVAGYALLISFWSNELGGEICNIDELYISPSFRGRGYGTSLIKDLRNRPSIWPSSFAAIELEVSPQNVKARMLYEALGFKPLRNSVMRLED